MRYYRSSIRWATALFVVTTIALCLVAGRELICADSSGLSTPLQDYIR